MKQLVRLNKRPRRSGFVYVLRYYDMNGKRRFDTLGHSDSRKAERQRTQKEKELRMGYCEPNAMKLSEFVDDSLKRSGDQLRESTQREYRSAMRDFMGIVGNLDIERISLSTGEYYRQVCLDHGNSPATVKKKLTELKTLFSLAVKRGQLEENPFRYIQKPKCTAPDINFFSDQECELIMKVAPFFPERFNIITSLRWDLLILIALSTALRRSEILNCTWADIDFADKTIRVNPKEDAKETWEWKIKDTDRRTLPLTDDLIVLLADYQVRLPEGYPYAFIPPRRYDYIQQELRAKGKWTYSDSRRKVVNNFNRDFGKILVKSHVKDGEFHDLRRTAICNWFAEGMTEFEVMKLAGHANFQTTHKYYLAVKEDLVHKAREVNARGLCKKLVQFGARANLGENQKRPPSVSP